MGCVSTLAEAWFGARERGLATAIASQANQLGSALAFAIGPAMVPDAGAAGGSPPEARANFVYNALFLALSAAATLACVLYYPSAPLLQLRRHALAPHQEHALPALRKADVCEVGGGGEAAGHHFLGLGRDTQSSKLFEVLPPRL